MKRSFCVLLAVVLAVSSLPGASAASVSDFSDVGESDWFYSAISFVTEKGMFNGTSGNTFSPYDTMTRGMFVTVLGRYGNVSVSVPVPTAENQGVTTKSDVNLRNSPTTINSAVLKTLPKFTRVEIIEVVADASDPSYEWYYVNHDGTKGYIRNDLMTRVSPDFDDVPADEYYTGYVYWAYYTGIAGQTGMDTFSPDRAITREEICSMMYNYASIRNLAINAAVSAKSFTDSASISLDYAETVSAMQQAGVVNGYDDGSFRPKASATRAEVSAMLSRFIDCVSYKPVTESSIDSNGNYIWGTEVPQTAQVSSGYFSDACFIGHSIVVGMKNNFGLSNADFYAYNGASAKSIQTYGGFELSSSTDENGNTVKNTGTLAEALNAKSYGKIYIMLGTNEAGVGSAHEQAFYSNMSALIDLVRSSQPNAKIYLFSLTPVSQSCSESRADLCRDNIIRYNAVIKTLCRDRNAYYLNVFDPLVNADGFLPDDAGMADGIHLLASQYAKMKNYVFTHIS